jgi:hypothetical protein
LPPQELWTVGHAVQGTLIAGQTGSGKSTGSGKQILCSFLEAGFGGLVLCAKADEADHIRTQCRACGREEDLIVVQPGGPWRFNPFTHEAERAGTSHVESIVGLFSALLELTQRSGGSSGRDGERYWVLACLQLVRNFVNLLLLATGRVSIDELYAAIVSAPNSLDQAASQAWRKSSRCSQLLMQADQNPKSPAQKRDLGLTADYILLEYAGLSDKTRSVVVSMFTSLIDVMQRGVLYELFGTDTTFTPECSAAGKIIVCDLSVKTHGLTGLIANLLLKHVWQKVMERRMITADSRPVFLWMDEAQHFLVSEDQLFLTTCRSARVATVLLTQNLPNVYAACGSGEQGKAQADSLLGNCCTKIFHANTDPVTNEWASSIIGMTRQVMASGNSSAPQDWVSTAIGLPRETTVSAGFNESWNHDVQPSVFTRLRTGGPSNGFLVDGILVQSGKVFADTGKIWRPVTFSQR